MLASSNSHSLSLHKEAITCHALGQGGACWIIDSGASACFTNDRTLLQHAVPHTGEVRVGNGEECKIMAQGSVQLSSTSSDSTFQVDGVLFAPDLSFNVLSTRQISSGAMKVLGEDLRDSVVNQFITLIKWETAWIFDLLTMRYLIEAHYDAEHGAYIADVQGTRNTMLVAATSAAAPRDNSKTKELLLKWHKRLAHAGMSQIELIAKTNSSLPPQLRSIGSLYQQIPPCRPCMVSQRHRETFGRSIKSATRPLEIVHIDISGINRTMSVSNKFYFLVFLDDYTRMTWVYFTTARQQLELSTAIKQFLTVKHKDGLAVQKFHADNEFNCTWFTELCKQNKIECSFIIPDTPQHNSRAERMMRTLKDPARAMLGASGLPLKFWDHAVATAAFVRNRVHHHRLKMSPYEMWTGRQPNLSFLRTFGCVCYPFYIQNTRERDHASGPYDPRGRIGIFLSYSLSTLGYIIYLPVEQKFVTSRDVVFDEDAFWNWGKPEEHAERKTWQAYDLWPETQQEAHRRAFESMTEEDKLKAAQESQCAVEQEAEQMEHDNDLNKLREKEKEDEARRRQQIQEENAARDKEKHQREAEVQAQEDQEQLERLVQEEEEEEERQQRVRAAEEANERAVQQAREEQVQKDKPETERQTQEQAEREQALQEEAAQERERKATARRERQEAMEQQRHAEEERKREKERRWQTGSSSKHVRFASTADTFTNCDDGPELVEHLPYHCYFDSMQYPALEQFNAAHFTLHRQAGTRARLEGAPVSMTDVKRRQDWPLWRDAMQEEYSSLQKTGTFEVVDSLPPGKNLVGCTWVLAQKVDIVGKPVRYKARLVAQGFTQRHGIDFQETFSPVIKLAAFRILLAAAIVRGYCVKFMDVKTAYLNGVNEHEIYMTQPDDFKIPGQEGAVLRVIKSLYGLKASGREWYKTLKAALEAHHFHRSSFEDCAFFNMSTGVILLVYVDDLVILSPDSSSEAAAIAFLTSTFTMTASPCSSAFLGIALETLPNDQRGYALSQMHYIKTILRRFDLDREKAVKRPIDPNVKLTTAPEGYSASAEFKHQYLSKIGSLLWVAQVTRPDISFAVGALGRFAANPTKQHDEAANQVFRYLSGTMNHVLVYNVPAKTPCNLALSLVTFSDADFAGDSNTRKSTTGYLMVLNGMTVDWLSKLQTTVARSTADAEFIALSTAAVRAIGTKNLLNEMFPNSISTALPLLTDSAAALSNAQELSNHSKLKHLDVKYHAVREKQADGTLSISQIPSAHNKADKLTKPMTAGNADKFREDIKLVRHGRVAETTAVER